MKASAVVRMKNQRLCCLVTYSRN